MESNIAAANISSDTCRPCTMQHEYIKPSFLKKVKQHIKLYRDQTCGQQPSDLFFHHQLKLHDHFLQQLGQQPGVHLHPEHPLGRWRNLSSQLIPGISLPRLRPLSLMAGLFWTFFTTEGPAGLFMAAAGFFMATRPRPRPLPRPRPPRPRPRPRPARPRPAGPSSSPGSSWPHAAAMAFACLAGEIGGGVLTVASACAA